MISFNDKQLLKKYRHLIAALIDESLGYFTPVAALRAIQAHKANEAFGCEWYLHCSSQFFKSHNIHSASSDEFDKQLLKVNHNAIKSAFKRRHHRNLKDCLAIVDFNINGDESIGASWF